MNLDHWTGPYPCFPHMSLVNPCIGSRDLTNPSPVFNPFKDNDQCSADSTWRAFETDHNTWPLISDCKAIPDDIIAEQFTDSGAFTITDMWGWTWLGSHGTCNFGVKPATVASKDETFNVGLQDIEDLINDACNSHSDAVLQRVGVRGRMTCGDSTGEYGDVTVDWLITADPNGEA